MSKPNKKYKRKSIKELRDVEVNYRGRSILVLSWSIALSIMILSALAGIDIIQTGELSDNTATFLLPIFTGLLGIVSGFVASKGPALAGSADDPKRTEFEEQSLDPVDPFDSSAASASAAAAGTATAPELMTLEDEDEDEDDDDDDFADDEDEDDLIDGEEDEDVDVDPVTGIPVDATPGDSEEDPGIEGARTSPEFGGDEADLFDEDDSDDEFAELDFDLSDDDEDDDTEPEASK